ncbi:adenosylmethionine--8-amino-7-oxononanoate transaminase [Planctomicrobium piriforme]|uniref:Adenosylmethionine-8-amino-7-oxononanoate aminotransferase n=1 Tax=Planctomicrobium piriforme TaxID=1576369 RepID=A0A1I3DMX0_9PLAN|nr:adenosylmethionine--8-amino-7-oxononanoate transaminase [Planctomicrobium piriforme]SFH88023.1 adenosylmethionine-8-amino-7-oxononanoate aminotransferase [Planctomicrobium piriforme]
MTVEPTHLSKPEQLRAWDNAHVWHPFTAMQAYEQEQAPIITSAEGFELIDFEGNRYLDGISSLWCNVHGHRVPEIDAAIKAQVDRVSHSTLLGLSSEPSIELARRLVERAPAGLTRVFYSDSGATAVEAALKMAFQYHRQKGNKPEQRDLFCTVGNAYHGDTIGSVSVGSMELFHRVYGPLLFRTLSCPSPQTLRRPVGFTAEGYREFCFAEVERIVAENASRLAAFIIEPLVQGAAGILVHPPGYLRHVREVTRRHGVPLIADEVAVGFGRTGTLFACEQEDVSPDLMCLAKGLTGGYLPVAATLATDEIYSAFLGDPSEGRTFFHGHTFTGNPLGCAAGLASLELFERNKVLQNVASNSLKLRERLSVLDSHPHVAQIRQKGIMVGVELVRDRETLTSFPSERRTGHQVTLAARRRGVIVRPLGDVAVLMPAPAMPGELIDRLCDVFLESIDEATLES